jgi:hypothetical protein
VFLVTAFAGCKDILNGSDDKTAPVDGGGDDISYFRIKITGLSLEHINWFNLGEANQLSDTGHNPIAANSPNDPLAGYENVIEGDNHEFYMMNTGGVGPTLYPAVAGSYAIGILDYYFGVGTYYIVRNVSLEVNTLNVIPFSAFTYNAPY